MSDPSLIIVVITLIVFVLCILILTKVCERAFDRRQQVQSSPSSSQTTRRTSIYIIEDNGDVLVINPSAGDVEKCDVKHSYENLAPPPYFPQLNALAEASYELPPSYPIIEIET